jgi:glutamate---cysteine ligase / carboxylate-amine ligase
MSTAGQYATDSLDLAGAREIFDASTDFTIGLEEEFALVDPDSLELVHRFEELREACGDDPALAESVAGELIDTEIEIRSGRAESFAEAMELQLARRVGLFDRAARTGIGLAATGTHPWANYLDQRIIDTEHYNRLRDELRWVAQRNNTWSMHVHVGVRGADRAIAVCDHLRALLPPLLALSANSPFLDGEDTGLASVRTEIFTRTFPRCGVHEPFGDWATYADFIGLLADTGRVVEATQLWWSVRPHHAFGTVELRICDAQTRGDEAFALAQMITAMIVQSALDYDDGRLGPPMRQREIEENLWQAIRHGLDGTQIDFQRREVIEIRVALERLIEWAAPAADALGLDLGVPDANGSIRMRRLLEDGVPLADVFRAAIEETVSTYLP